MLYYLISLPLLDICLVGQWTDITRGLRYFLFITHKILVNTRFLLVGLGVSWDEVSGFKAEWYDRLLYLCEFVLWTILFHHLSIELFNSVKLSILNPFRSFAVCELQTLDKNDISSSTSHFKWHFTYYDFFFKKNLIFLSFSLHSSFIPPPLPIFLH